MTEYRTYYADTELPLTLIQDGDRWVLMARWNNRESGMECTFDERPDRETRHLVHKMFIRDKKLWGDHNKIYGKTNSSITKED